jgi:hypothetical protein
MTRREVMGILTKTIRTYSKVRRGTNGLKGQCHEHEVDIFLKV